MNSDNHKTLCERWQYAGANLRRLKQSGVYYLFAKRNGKQFSRSLKTTDKPLAKRRAADYLLDLERLVPSEAANLSFDQVAARWLETTRHTIKASSHDRRQRSLNAVAPFFSGLPVKNIAARHCEAWLTQRVTKRGSKIAAQTFAHELNAMRAVFAFAVEHGMILRNPADCIKKPRIVSKKTNVPTREQFQQAVAAIRAEPRERGGADLVELMAYSGMRLREATALRWRDVNFSAGVFTVTGGEVGTKNHEQRTVPISAELLALLTRIKRGRGKVGPAAHVVEIANARRCLDTVCRKLGFPHWHNHSLRHYFATCAVESGVDIPTIAKWTGHKDGGALLMKRYAHLQQAHSVEQMKRVNFHAAPVPKSERGRKLAAILEAGKREREPLLSDAELEREIKERRGRNF